jgi:hypothetical protein
MTSSSLDVIAVGKTFAAVTELGRTAPWPHTFSERLAEASQSHPDDPQYIVRLPGRVIMASLATVKVVEASPAL